MRSLRVTTFKKMKDSNNRVMVTLVLVISCLTQVLEGSFIGLEELPSDPNDHSGEGFGKLADEEHGQYFLKVATEDPKGPTGEEALTRSESGTEELRIQEAMDIHDHRNEDPLTDSALNIPGVPGIDYPTFNEVPITGFHCQEQRYKGFFADLSTKCQAWHYCDFSDGQSTFLCPNGTLFSQVLLTCDWWFNVNCQEAQQLYVLNESLYRYVKTPKRTFPEDYHGPEVDLWLKRQLQLGILPKRPRNKLKLVDKE